MKRLSYSLGIDHIALKMKSMIIAVLALACVLGLTSANYYGYYPTSGGSGLGGGSLLALIGFLFLFLILFSNNNTSSGSTVTIINGTATG